MLTENVVHHGLEHERHVLEAHGSDTILVLHALHGERGEVPISLAQLELVEPVGQITRRQH